jgi:hypothetical protein
MKSILNFSDYIFEEYYSQKQSSPTAKNIIIGDSQSPYVDWGSEKFTLLSTQGSETALWKGGQGLSWLNGAILKHPGSSEIKNIAICIGTNGGFNPNEKISDLIDNIRNKFPKANLFAIQGSWGWGGNIDVSEKKVRNYYSIFSKNGVHVIDPPIGPIEPHGRKPIYQKIGAELDKNVN